MVDTRAADQMMSMISKQGKQDPLVAYPISLAPATQQMLASSFPVLKSPRRARRALAVGLPVRSCSENRCRSSCTSRITVGPYKTNHILPNVISRTSLPRLRTCCATKRATGKALTKPSSKAVLPGVLQACLVEEEASGAIPGVDGNEVPV